MKNEVFIVSSNESIAKDVYRMHLIGDTRQIGRAGQFVNIALQGHYLRRPISVCDADETGFTIIYKTVGEGTRRMAGMQRGQRLEALVGLGNGFDADACPKACTLVGGGVGVPPMYMLAKELIAAKKSVTVILGFNTAREVFYESEFEKLGCRTLITTADGSRGIKGFVTDAMAGLDYTYTFACGPEPMLKAVYTAANTSGQYSFEERMGCGFGACMGCSCETKYGAKRICKDGPVLEKEEIIW